VPNAPRILQRDVYGWFERVTRATYRVTERARRDLQAFAASGLLPDLPPTSAPAPSPPGPATPPPTRPGRASRRRTRRTAEARRPAG
jgi:hypothetical protein